MFSPKKRNGKLCDVMEVLAKSTVVTYCSICVSNQYVVHLKVT